MAVYEETSVLVVGAGPVGLMTACELLRHGVDCRIIDRKSGPTPLNESRALGIQARTMEIFHELGIAAQVVAQGRPLNGLSAFHEASRIAHLSLDFEDLDTRYSHIYCLPQSVTERLLIDRLASLGGKVEWDTNLQSIGQTSTSTQVKVAADKTNDLETILFQASWVVGCDGSRSTVRKALELKFEGGEYEEKFLIADVRMEWGMPVPDDEIVFFLTPEGLIVTFPMPDSGRFRLVDTSGVDVGTDPAAIVDRFRELITKHVCERAQIDDPSWTSSFHIHRRVVATYQKGRIFVAGDAAHLHSPAGGQGMNTGIQDAYNLAWKLALVAKKRAPESLLASYSTERRTAAAGVLKGSDQLTRLVTLRNELAKGLRDKLLGVLGQFDFVRRKAAKEVSELAIGYRDSPIVAEDHGSLLHSITHPAEAPGLRNLLDFAAGPRPGDRAPDVAIGEGHRLSDFKHPTLHTLLLFEGPSESPLQDVADLARTTFADLVHPVLVARDAGPRSWSAGEILADVDGVVHESYRATAACLYLVRPDGYIGYRALPADAVALQAYLDRQFPKL